MSISIEAVYEAGVFKPVSPLPHIKEHEHVLIHVSDIPEDVNREFRRLVDKWLEDTCFTSSPTQMILHPAYLGIIGFGPVVTPLLLLEVQKMSGHWFCALRAIEKVDPAEDVEAGDFQAIG